MGGVMTPQDARPKAEPAAEPVRLLTPGKLWLQLLFWLIGLALLAWIIRGAIEKGDWSRVTSADPLLVAALLGCTVLSALINGAAFWITVQPMRPLTFWDMQRLNFVGNLLNYAPVRAGALARIMYHHRVDRLGLLQMGAWFAMLGATLALSVVACLAATVVRGEIDAIWFAIIFGVMALGALTFHALAKHPLLIAHGRGIDKLLGHPRGVWGAMALRLADVAAFSGRMAAALAILEIHLPAQQVIVLAIVALASSMIPFGRVGFREACVALAAGALASSGESGDPVPWEQLALVESAGEAVIFLPAGALAMIWFLRRWRAAGR